MKKRLFTLVLSTALLLSLAACKTNPDSHGTSSESATESTDSTGEITQSSDDSSITDTSSDESVNSGSAGKTNATTSVNTVREVVNNCYTVGLPIAKERVKMTVMIRDQSNGLAKYTPKDQPMIKWMEDTFNVTIEFKSVPPTEAVAEQMTLSYLANTMPDMFWGMASSGYNFHQKYINNNQVIEVGKYLDKFGPNIKKMFKEQPSAEYLCTNESGKIYMLPHVTIEDNFYQKMYINNTWLKKSGKKMPTTVAELRNVLIHFRDNDMNGNGDKKDEIPMAMSPTAGWIQPSLMSSFGYSTYLDWFSVDDSGKVVYVPMTNEYREFIKFYRDLRNEELLYNKFRELTPPQIKTLNSGSLAKIGVIMAETFESVMTPERFIEDYTIVPPLKANTTGKPLWGYTVTENIHNDWFLISANCKYPEIATRIADYFYSTEGTTTALYGPPDKNNAWYKDGNGKFVSNVAKKPAKKSTGEWQYQFTPGYPIPHYVSNEYKSYTNYASPNPSNLEKALKIQTLLVDKYFSPAKPKNILYKVNNTAKETEQLKKVGNYTKTANEASWAFIGGDSSPENQWDSYIQNLKRQGIDTAISIRQTAMDRYKVWLKNHK